LRFAILGGSFDPIHKGHIKLAEAVLNLGYNRVIFVPAFRSPFKSEIQSSTAQKRLELLLASISGDRRFTVDACEIKREGASYTVDTIRSIIKRYQMDSKPALILGSDLVFDFPKWKCAEEIAELSDIIIAKRGSKSTMMYPHMELNNRVNNVSSSQIRTLISTGAFWYNLVPKGAAKIIKAENLYSRHNTHKNKVLNLPKKLSPRKLSLAEDFVRSKLCTYRFIHSRNVALHASDLAERFGLNIKDAYFAGITHDMCKELPETELISLSRHDGLPFSDLETKKPAILHGRAAAVMLQEQLNIKNESIIEAVRYHTMGSRGELAKIIFISDKIESARENVDPKLRTFVFDSAHSNNLDEIYNVVRIATDNFIRENKNNT
jgi:nicotinate-nucleotide adenylyltransferase